MIQTKNSSVNITNLHPNLKQFLDDMSNKFDGIVVTSGNDSLHLPNSRHYIDKAIDIGANSSEKNAYSNFKNYVFSNESEVKNKYQIEDIIDESNHIHIELPLTLQEQKTIQLKQFGLIAFVLLFAGVSIYLKWLSKNKN